MEGAHQRGDCPGLFLTRELGSPSAFHREMVTGVEAAGGLQPADGFAALVAAGGGAAAAIQLGQPQAVGWGIAGAHMAAAGGARPSAPPLAVVPPPAPPRLWEWKDSERWVAYSPWLCAALDAAVNPLQPTLSRWRRLTAKWRWVGDEIGAGCCAIPLSRRVRWRLTAVCGSF